jgi:probable rRNA maturation factor
MRTTLAIVDRQRRVRVSPGSLRRAAARTLAALGRPAGEIELLLVDDPEIRRLNARHRGVARRTDVLAFPMETPDGASGLLGQIVVSTDTASRQAARLGVPVALELELLLTHGILHLVGYDDRDPVEARLMHERERALMGRPTPARLWQGLLAG